VSGCPTIRRVVTVCLALAFVCAGAGPALAYLKFGFELNGRATTLRWPRSPVRYFVTNRGVSGVSASDLQGAVSRAFATWESVPTASIAYSFGGLTSAGPGEDDGRNTLGFESHPEFDRVLASTSYLIDDVTGELLESDIFFNATFAWSVAAGGDRTRWDVESIALHEIGHLSGLGHSAIGETEGSAAGRRVSSVGAVMFPIALGAGDISGRQLFPDDIAGISDLYPDGGFSDTRGSISGHVTKSGRGVYGAHVVAFDLRNGEQVGNFTLDSRGGFAIAGLRPGPHVVRVEPVDDADVQSFFDPLEPVDIRFGVTYYERLVIVPRGGDSGPIQIAVPAR
jgi:hypothetical protein